VGLIAVAIIFTVMALGTKLDGLFKTIKDALPGGAAPAAP
jgi:Flp pilus assembly pilin Flp